MWEMMKKASTTETIARQLLSKHGGAAQQQHPSVLSCGGIFIPRKCRERKGILCEILITPNQDEPVKLVTGAKSRSILSQVLIKESLN